MFAVGSCKITAPVNTAINTDSVTLAGSVVSFAGPVSLTLDGAPVALTGADDTQGSFQQGVDLLALGNPATLTLVASDARVVKKLIRIEISTS